MPTFTSALPCRIEYEALTVGEVNALVRLLNEYAAVNPANPGYGRVWPQYTLTRSYHGRVWAELQHRWEGEPFACLML